MNRLNLSKLHIHNARDQEDPHRGCRIRNPDPISEVQQDFDGLVEGEWETFREGMRMLAV